MTTVTSQPAHPVSPPDRSSRRATRRSPGRSVGRRFGIGFVGVAVLGLLSTGCGGAPQASVASLGSTTTTTAASVGGTAGSSGSITTSQLSFAKCMHSHGEHGYPEPGGGATSVVAALQKLDPSSRTFQTAQTACRAEQPAGPPASPAESAKVLNQSLKFASCMRSHGMTKWPDPSARGGYMVALVGAAATSPTYVKAAKICKPLLPTG